MGAMGTQQQLRFNAVHAGRMLQQLDHMFEQPALNVRGQLRIAGGWDCKNISNQRLFALVHAKHVPADPAVFNGHIARQEAGIEVLQQEVGGSVKIPAQSLVPDKALRFQHGFEIAGRKMSQIKNFEMQGRSHPRLNRSVRHKAIPRKPG